MTKSANILAHFYGKCCLIVQTEGRFRLIILKQMLYTSGKSMIVKE